ncbi:MAG: methylated-DNA--[protein]-cysteine S-methyltransferase [Burkholderiales bacterium]|uniref:methylated-DNA--[protein]-cysteine S-methyltransferase n=1 Tax=Limnobacter sp. TaxID=2003368 RepID=UPI0039BC953C|nr:methylated-DNA--[protein]-cysteine S-methyltransferase [Burkholderiales bacterium]
MTQFETQKQYKLVAKAIQILEQHANHFATEATAVEPKLTLLARHLNTSPHHLQRTFTEWAGISPKQFFQCLQKDHARKLIAAGHSMLETSTTLGLSSSSKLHNLMLKFEALTPGEIKNAGLNQTFIIGEASSPFGQVFVCLTNKGINSLEFETDELTYRDWKNGISNLYPKATFIESDSKIKLLIEPIFDRASQAPFELNVYLRGTPFQLQVWQALIHLPIGQLASYQQIANSIGKSSASRAVGSAVAKNPIAFLIPCHRVIQATGELGQYRWQSERKKALHLWEQGQIQK